MTLLYVGKVLFLAFLIVCTLVGINTLVDKAVHRLVGKRLPPRSVYETDAAFKARMRLMDIEHEQFLAMIAYRTARGAQGTLTHQCLPSLQDTYTDYDRYKTSETACIAQLEAQAHSKKSRVLRGVEEP